MQSRDMLDQINKAFQYDWNDYKTIKNSKEMLKSVASCIAATQERFNSYPNKIINKPSDKFVSFGLKPIINSDGKEEYWVTDISEKEKSDFAQLSLKLGAYKLFIQRKHDAAFFRLLDSVDMVTDFNESLEIRSLYAFSAIKAGHFFWDDWFKFITRERDVPESHPNLPFIHFVVGFDYWEKYNNFVEANKSFSHALELYNSHHKFDDTAAFIKRFYAMALVEEESSSSLAKADEVYASLAEYYTNQNDNSNPEAARFYVTYADYLAKTKNDPASAKDNYKKSYEILKNQNQLDNRLVETIYERLAECYSDETETSFAAADFFIAYGDHLATEEDSKVAMQKYSRAYDILSKTQNASSARVVELVHKMGTIIFNSTLTKIADQLSSLPLCARGPLVESCCAILLSEITQPKNISQYFAADQKQLDSLNLILDKKDGLKNLARNEITCQSAGPTKDFYSSMPRYTYFQNEEKKQSEKVGSEEISQSSSNNFGKKI